MKKDPEDWQVLLRQSTLQHSVWLFGLAFAGFVGLVLPSADSGMWGNLSDYGLARLASRLLIFRLGGVFFLLMVAYMLWRRFSLGTDLVRIRRGAIEVLPAARAGRSPTTVLFELAPGHELKVGLRRAQPLLWALDITSDATTESIPLGSKDVPPNLLWVLEAWARDSEITLIVSEWDEV